MAAAAVVGGAAVAGLFLWSRRNEISDQIGNLADQINDWRDGLASGGETAFAEASAQLGGSDDSHRSQTEIAEEAMTLKQIGQPV